MASNKRKKTLIRPALQLRICLTFMVASATGLTVMLAVLMSLLQGIEVKGEEVLPTLLPKVMKAYWIALSVTLPGTLAVGILSTFLIAGPLHRFCLFLNDVRAGKNPRDCKLRAGDELTDFCDLLNQVTRPLRTVEEAPEEERDHQEAA